jgi:hypothetical protein
VVGSLQFGFMGELGRIAGLFGLSSVFLCTKNGEAKRIQVEMKIQQARMKATRTTNNKNNYLNL